MKFNFGLIAFIDSRVVKKAGRRRHILNLGHGVLVGTPEESVSHFFETARQLSYDSLFVNQEPIPV